jgi:hypothetical protein
MKTDPATKLPECNEGPAAFTRFEPLFLLPPAKPGSRQWGGREASRRIAFPSLPTLP